MKIDRLKEILEEIKSLEFLIKKDYKSIEELTDEEREECVYRDTVGVGDIPDVSSVRASLATLELLLEHGDVDNNYLLVEKDDIINEGIGSMKVLFVRREDYMMGRPIEMAIMEVYADCRYSQDKINNETMKIVDSINGNEIKLKKLYAELSEMGVVV